MKNASRITLSLITMSTLTATPTLAHEGHSHGMPLGLIGAIIAIGGAIAYWAWRHNA